MKIICVAQNYPEHNKEMNVPLSNMDDDPVLFMKPDSAILKDGKPFYIPDFSENIHYEAELVIKINRLGKNIAERFAHRYYEEITIGIDFTARDIQQNLKAKGLPWEQSKAFDNSAVIGNFISKDELNKEIPMLNFSLLQNGTEVQKAQVSEMIHPIDKIISFSSRFYTLKIGDLIFTGTPAGVGKVNIGDRLQGFLEDKKLLDFYVK